MPDVELTVSPAAALRLLAVGWTVPEALFALIDNAVQAEAANVWVHVRKHRDDLSDASRNNVAAYEVVDDGRGMDAAGLAAALSLAAGDEPADGSLSKFGLGLKAAAQSQGDALHLISSPGGGIPFEKRVVVFDSVRPDRYFATAPPLSADDEALIAAHLPGGHGTIVRIADVRKGGHPSVRDTTQTFRYRAGVVYYYFLLDGLTLTIQDEAVEPFDVLATDEADDNGVLNEHDWDGQSVRWIQRPRDITLDAERGVQATVEVTQLPYPPMFDVVPGPGLQDAAATRRRYRIEAPNYGYYVYRNKRLIAWAERLDRVLPRAQQQDMFAFRGRVLVDESADEALNIDLKKAHVQLSDEARITLKELSDAYAAKSRKAWKRAGAEKKRREGDEPNKRANELAADFDPPELAAEATATPAEATQQARREQDAEQAARARMRREAARTKAADTGQPVEASALTDAEVTEIARGGPENPAASRIFRVGHVEDNALWEPYFDADHGWSVRINAPHKFGRVIFERNADNADLQVLFELLLLTMAQAEVQTQKVTRLPREDAEQLLGEFRRSVSEFLAKLCFDLGDRLPPSVE